MEPDYVTGDSCQEALVQILNNMLPPVYTFIAVIVMISLHMTVPLFYLVDSTYRFLGSGFMVFGVWVILYSVATFRRMDTTIHPFGKSLNLATHGFYRLTRNPMYLGMLCILVGLAIGLGSVTPAVVPIVFMWLITERFIKNEEKQLEHLFGERYIQYKQAVRRWL